MGQHPRDPREMDPRPLAVVTFDGGPHHGQRFVTPMERLSEDAVIGYVDGEYTLRRSPESGRWQACPVAAQRAVTG